MGVTGQLAAAPGGDKMLFKEDLDENGIPKECNAANGNGKAGMSSSMDYADQDLSTSAGADTEEDMEMDPVKKAKYTGNGYVNLVHSDDEVHPPNLSIEALRKALPKECFVKSPAKSIMWMLIDMSLVTAFFMVGKHYIYMSEDMSFAMKCCVMPLIWAFAGFFMWSDFVVGHDCGHGSFSDSKTMNFVCGLISHGFILVPFSAWARSHRFHHMYHNHVRKDYSFPWAHDPDLDNPAQRFLKNKPVFRAWFFPILGYFFYLNAPQRVFGAVVGVDGNHYIPLRSEKIWKDADQVEIRMAWISTAAVVAYIAFFIAVLFNPTFNMGAAGACCDNLSFDFFTVWEALKIYYAVYVPSWFVFTYWLYTVTYLQHHGPTTKIYDDTTWRYLTAAFETIDRRYGGPIDLLHHRISDCHVVHHIFFTKIPHYNLRTATAGLMKYLEDNNLKHMYQYDEAPDFYTRVFKYMYNFGTRAHLYTKYGGLKKLAELKLKLDEKKAARQARKEAKKAAALQAKAGKSD